MSSPAVLWRGSWNGPLLFVYHQRGVIVRTRIVTLVLDSIAVDFWVNLSLCQAEERSWKWNWVPLLSLCFNKRKRNVSEMHIKTSRGNNYTAESASPRCQSIPKEWRLCRNLGFAQIPEAERGVCRYVFRVCVFLPRCQTTQLAGENAAIIEAYHLEAISHRSALNWTVCLLHFHFTLSILSASLRDGPEKWHSPRLIERPQAQAKLMRGPRTDASTHHFFFVRWWGWLTGQTAEGRHSCVFPPSV